MDSVCRESPFLQAPKPSISKYGLRFIYSFSQQVFIVPECVLGARDTKLRGYSPYHLESYSLVINNFFPKNIQ